MDVYAVNIFIFPSSYAINNQVLKIYANKDVG